VAESQGNRRLRTAVTRYFWPPCVLLSLSAFAFAVAGAPAERPLILRGAAIYTLNPRQPWATALVISGERIAYVGNDAGALARGGKFARVISLHGAMVLPGFHDGHAHPMSAGLRFLRCDLAGLKTAEQTYAAIRTCAATKARKGWLIGHNWSPQAFPRGTNWRVKLDALVPNAAAYMANDNGYTARVNSRALSAAAIDPEAAVPERDGLGRDPVTHKPSGVVSGAALERIHALLPKPSQAEYREALRHWMALASGFGITSVFDASAKPTMLDAYHSADVAGELTVRVVAAQLVDAHLGPEQVDAFVAQRDRVRGHYFRADAAKLFLDGEIAMRTAALLASYAGMPATRGDLLFSAEKLNGIVQRLDADGFSIHMHAMGDRAVRAGLDAVEFAMRENGARDRRHQIAHAGVVDPADLLRFGKLGVAANLQPGWFQAGDPVMAETEAVLGPPRSGWIYPAASIAKRGGRIVMSSDWPATSLNPLDNIQIAVTRQPLDGSRPAKRPEERIDLATAIAAYTRNAAWVAREDGIDGTIEVGKAADLAVLDRNLFRTKPDMLHNARVLLTLLAGKPVYRDPHFRWP